jgi:hypothetical protein
MSFWVFVYWRLRFPLIADRMARSEQLESWETARELRRVWKDLDDSTQRWIVGAS